MEGWIWYGLCVVFVAVGLWAFFSQIYNWTH